MKAVFLSIVFIVLLNSAFSQNLNCNEFITGDFVVRNEKYGDSNIKRTKKYQVESSTNIQTGKKVKTKNKIVWVDDCTYKLIPIKVNDPNGLVGNDILIFRITETHKSYYIVNVTGIKDMNFEVKVYVKE